MRALLALAVVLVGCAEFEPWVDELPAAPGLPDIVPCARTVECALLDELETGPREPAPEAPAPSCPGGRFEQTLEIDDDTRIDAASVGCARLVLDVDVEAGESPVVMVLEGATLGGAELTIRSALRPVEVRLELARLHDTRIVGEGAIAITGAGVELERVELRASSLRFEGGAHRDVTASAESLLLREARITRARLDAARLTYERGVLSDAVVLAQRADLVGTDVRHAIVEVEALAAGGGDWIEVEIARCGRLALSRVHLTRSRVAACEDGVLFDELEAFGSVFLGDLEGELGYYAECAFAGETIELRSGIRDSAFCGVSRLSVRDVQCMRCEPDSPPDVCGLVDGDTSACPGVCEAACEGGSLVFGGQACRHRMR